MMLCDLEKGKFFFLIAESSSTSPNADQTKSANAPITDPKHAKP